MQNANTCTLTAEKKKQAKHTQSSCVNIFAGFLQFAQDIVVLIKTLKKKVTVLINANCEFFQNGPVWASRDIFTKSVKTIWLIRKNRMVKIMREPASP